VTSRPGAGSRIPSQRSRPLVFRRVPGTGQDRQTLPVSTKASRTRLEEGVDLAGKPRSLQRGFDTPDLVSGGLP